MVELNIHLFHHSMWNSVVEVEPLQNSTQCILQLHDAKILGYTVMLCDNHVKCMVN